MTEVEAPRAMSEFDPVVSARGLLRCVRRASLATKDSDGGGPYVSLIAVASDEDGAPLMLVSNLA
ncbi:MAG: HugZ family protein, partial [Hansschlegelia sp.]